MDVDSSSDDSSSDDDSYGIEGHVRDYLALLTLGGVALPGVVEAAAEALWRLTDESDNEANCAAIVKADGIPALVAFLATNGSWHPNAHGQKAAARALGNLAHDNAANRVAIVAAGAVDPLVVMRDAGGRLKEAAEAALEALDLAAIASRVEALQAENESLTSRLETKCVVCFERAPDVVFMPCFHAVSCLNCGLREEVDTCPICRVPIKHKRRIYVS